MSPASFGGRQAVPKFDLIIITIIMFVEFFFFPQISLAQNKTSIYLKCYLSIHSVLLCLALTVIFSLHIQNLVPDQFVL